MQRKHKSVTLTTAAQQLYLIPPEVFRWPGSKNLPVKQEMQFPGLVRAPGEENLGNPIDRRAWWDTIRGVTRV